MNNVSQILCHFKWYLQKYKIRVLIHTAERIMKNAKKKFWLESEAKKPFGQRPRYRADDNMEFRCGLN
jgi:hypothetical protein